MPWGASHLCVRQLSERCHQHLGLRCQQVLLMFLSAGSFLQALKQLPGLQALGFLES